MRRRRIIIWTAVVRFRLRHPAAPFGYLATAWNVFAIETGESQRLTWGLLAAFAGACHGSGFAREIATANWNQGQQNMSSIASGKNENV